MAKFYGPIGFALQPEESVPGNWITPVVEKNYRGDVLTNQVLIQSGEKVNNDVSIDNSISIVSDAYVYYNISFLKYFELNKIAWKIQSFSNNRPRIILKIGGVYNGERPISPP